jgi:hypothetical protein
MAVLFKGPNADRRKLETFEKRTSGGEYEEMAASAVKEVIASWEKLEEAKRKEAEEAKQVKLRAGAPTLTSMFAGRK